MGIRILISNIVKKTNLNDYFIPSNIQDLYTFGFINHLISRRHSDSKQDRFP